MVTASGGGLYPIFASHTVRTIEGTKNTAIATPTRIEKRYLANARYAKTPKTEYPKNNLTLPI